MVASAGRSPHLIQHLSNVTIDYQNGMFSGTNGLIEVIGNHTPMTVEEFVTSRKDAPAQRPALRAGRPRALTAGAFGSRCPSHSIRRNCSSGASPSR